MMSDDQLREAAGDYIAGDLDDAERARFEALRESDDELTGECAFWERMRGCLPEHGRPQAEHLPTPGMLAVARRRAAESDRQPAASTAKVIAFPMAALGWAVAAAAMVVLAVFITRPQNAPQQTIIIAYGEDGTAEVVPENRPAFFASNVRNVTHSQPGLHADEHARPWLGLWTKPVELGGFERSKGLRVVRVVMNSPAAKAGIRPGDTLLDFAGCPMATRWCIAHAIHVGGLTAGDSAELSYIDHDTGQVVTAEVALSCYFEACDE